jgi:spermidine synthase
VGSLIVVEMLQAVVDWHAAGHLPLDPPLGEDARCRFITDDFFARAQSEAGFDPARPGRKFDAILIDIDHTPDWLLDARSGSFYSEDGLAQLRAHLRPGGVMGLWSDAREDEDFTQRLARVFGSARAEPVTFHNPLQDKLFTQTVYLGRNIDGSISSK